MKAISEWWGPVGGAAAIVMIYKGLSNGWETAEILAAALLGSLFVAWLIRLVRRIRRVPNAFALLSIESGLLVSQYKELHERFPTDTRYPLKPSSTPEFGKVWTFADIRMARCAGRFFELISMGKLVSESIEHGNAIPLLQQPELVSMTALIAHLEQFHAAMEARANRTMTLAETQAAAAGV